MDSTTTEPALAEQTPFTPADRIRDLLLIDQDVTKMLHSASSSILALTTPPSPTSPSPKLAFEHHTIAFYNLVHSISAHLRRQTYALEEANIIAATQLSLESNGTQTAPLARPGVWGGGVQVKIEPLMQITNGGLGGLDVGWLNSRRDGVGKEKEAELWRQMRALLEDLERGEVEERDVMDIDGDEVGV